MQNAAADLIIPSPTAGRGVGDTAVARDAFANAVRLARRGRYQEAREMLAQALDQGACKPAEVHDLDARMFAQQGLLFDADAAWARAQAADPANPAYSAGRARLRHDSGRRFFWADWALAGISVLLVGLFIVLALAWRGLDARIAQADRSYGEKLAVQQDAVGQAVRSLELQVDGVERDLLGRIAAAQSSLEAKTGSPAQADVLERLLPRLDQLVDQVEASRGEGTQAAQSMMARADAADHLLQAIDRRILELDARLARLDSEVGASQQAVLAGLDQVAQEMKGLHTEVVTRADLAALAGLIENLRTTVASGADTTELRSELSAIRLLIEALPSSATDNRAR
jgi:hypothetical protein